MAIKKWFTQPSYHPGRNPDQNPEDCLSSFYYYDTSEKKLVRIRLELKRKDGPPVIIVRSNRYIGFHPSAKLLDCNTVDKWTVNETGAISYREGSDSIDLSTDISEEMIDMRTYDFSLAPLTDNQHPGRVHIGTIFTRTPTLPSGVNENILEVIAEHYINGDDCSCKFDVKSVEEVGAYLINLHAGIIT
jgi:hypothetical protein